MLLSYRSSKVFSLENFPLYGIELTMVDRCIIILGDLSDKYFDFAQALPRKHHKELTGLNPLAGQSQKSSQFCAFSTDLAH